MRKFVFVFILALLAIFLEGCSPEHRIVKQLKIDQDYDDYFLGLVVYDPVRKKELININGSRLFTPASNTKLFTYYVSQRALGDSVPMLEYARRGDSLLFRGTADPSTMYLTDSTSLSDFFEGQEGELYLIDSQIDEPSNGLGWAWGDYQYYYQAEKSVFPLFGNVVRYDLAGEHLDVTPHTFKKHITLVDSLVKRRDLYQNTFYAQSGADRGYTVPFKASGELTAKIIEDVVGRKITQLAEGDYNFKTYYEGLYDSLYKHMLRPSDNFIAEQLLLQVGKQVSGKYSVQEAIEYSLEHFLPGLPDTPRWVDGSGLSRYNLFSPNDLIYLLGKMYHEIEFSTLLELLPAGGESGTLRSWYKKEEPYVFAKSGSLSNNHNLSGYLVTEKGTVLLFSYMNNHYTQSTTRVKNRMQRIFEFLYDTY